MLNKRQDIPQRRLPVMIFTSPFSFLETSFSKYRGRPIIIPLLKFLRIYAFFLSLTHPPALRPAAGTDEHGPRCGGFSPFPFPAIITVWTRFRRKTGTGTWRSSAQRTRSRKSRSARPCSGQASATASVTGAIPASRTSCFRATMRLSS